MAEPASSPLPRGGARKTNSGRRREKRAPTPREMRKWAEDCPLWRWREQHRVSRPMSAAMFGVTNTSIWQWEHGAANPRPEHMSRLVEVLGPETVHLWVTWLARKPGWEEIELPRIRRGRAEEGE